MLKTPEFWYKKNIQSKIKSFILFPLSILWVLIDEFKRHLSKTYKSKLKVICIGNLTVGGTGKTPFSIYTYKLLKSSIKTHKIENGYRSVICTFDLIFFLYQNSGVLNILINIYVFISF